MIVLSFVYVVGFILVHLFSNQVLKFQSIPRSPLLSIFGGIAVAYVFVHLLPELNEYQSHIEGMIGSSFWNSVENHIYVVAMGGLALFYGLEKMAEHKKEESPASVFWIHIISFAMYNALIGYLLVKEDYGGGLGMFYYFLAMSVHFITNDHGLRVLHKGKYHKQGRWILSFAILLGWLFGVWVEITEWIISLLFAVLAGGVIVNVLKEELPEERKSRFSAFIIGLAGYTAILLFALG